MHDKQDKKLLITRELIDEMLLFQFHIFKNKNVMFH